jgi:putative hydrolase of the HAD superfamily
VDLQAVIFDYGEVLSGPPNPQAHQNLLKIAGVEEELFEKAYWAHRLDYDADILNGQTYWQAVARDTEAHFTPQQIEQLMEQDAAMWMDLNQAMVAWIPKIKQAGLKLGILSNMGYGVLGYIRPRFEWLDQFDHLTWSCELGVVKPDPAIYLHTLKKLQVLPEQALFIDNLEKNIVAAESVGLHALLFTSVDQLRKDLAQRNYPLPPLEP